MVPSYSAIALFVRTCSLYGLAVFRSKKFVRLSRACALGWRLNIHTYANKGGEIYGWLMPAK